MDNPLVLLILWLKVNVIHYINGIGNFSLSWGHKTFKTRFIATNVYGAWPESWQYHEYE